MEVPCDGDSLPAIQPWPVDSLLLFYLPVINGVGKGLGRD